MNQNMKEHHYPQAQSAFDAEMDVANNDAPATKHQQQSTPVSGFAFTESDVESIVAGMLKLTVEHSPPPRPRRHLMNILENRERRRVSLPLPLGTPPKIPPPTERPKSGVIAHLDRLIEQKKEYTVKKVQSCPEPQPIKPFPFQSLPAELQRMIMRMALVEPFGIVDPLPAGKRYGECEHPHARLPVEDPVTRKREGVFAMAVDVYSNVPTERLRLYTHFSNLAIEMVASLFEGPSYLTRRHEQGTKLARAGLAPNVLCVNKEWCTIGRQFLYENTFVFTNPHAMECFLNSYPHLRNMIKHIKTVFYLQQGSASGVWLGPFPQHQWHFLNIALTRGLLQNLYIHGKTFLMNPIIMPRTQRVFGGLMRLPDIMQYTASDPTLTRPHDPAFRKFPQLETLTLHVHGWHQSEWLDGVLENQHPCIGWRGRHVVVQPVQIARGVHLIPWCRALAHVGWRASTVRVTGMADAPDQEYVREMERLLQ